MGLPAADGVRKWCKEGTDKVQQWCGSGLYVVQMEYRGGAAVVRQWLRCGADGVQRGCARGKWWLCVSPSAAIMQEWGSDSQHMCDMVCVVL